MKEANGVLVVAQIQGDSPSSGKLAKDDVIEGTVEGTKLRSLTLARDFYEAIAAVKPGKTITLRMRGAGGAGRYVGRRSRHRRPKAIALPLRYARRQG